MARPGGSYREKRRRFDLALAMLRLNVRTRAICEWTGLSEPAVQNLARSQDAGNQRPVLRRLSGPAPSSLAPVRESRQLRSEGAAILGVCLRYGVLPLKGEPGYRPDLIRGERLCRAYELFMTFVPEPQLSLEYAMLLALKLAQREITLERCTRCCSILMVERPHEGYRCVYCRI